MDNSFPMQDNKIMNKLSSSLRYDVDDTSCPSKLFDANDISMQQVNMDTLGNEKEWVAVVNLNTKDDNGYLKGELPQCKVKDDHLIGSLVKVKVYLDEDNCCDGNKDYDKCKTFNRCGDKLVKLNDNRNKHYSKDVVMRGTHYTVINSHVERRRRLLQGRNSRC